MGKKRNTKKPKHLGFLTVETGTRSESTFRRYYETGINKVINSFHLPAEKKEAAKKAIDSWVKSHYYIALGTTGFPVSMSEARNILIGLKKFGAIAKKQDYRELVKLAKAAQTEAEEKIARGKPFQFSNKNAEVVQTALLVNIRDSLGLQNFILFQQYASALVTLAEKATINAKN